MKKLLFFLFVSVISISSFIVIGLSTNYVYYQTSIQTENYLYENNIADYSGNYVYPIAQINFNYPTGTNFTSLYPTFLTPTSFSGMIQSILYPDFTTQTQYYTKYLNVKSLISSIGQPYIRTYRYNDFFRHYNVKFRFIVIPTLTTDSIFIYYNNSISNTHTYYEFRLDSNYIKLRLVNGSELNVGSTPFPAFGSYDFIAIDVIQNYVYLDYTEAIHYTAFKTDGTIVGENSFLTNAFKDFSDYQYNSVDFKYVGDIGIICEDMNLPMSLSNTQIDPKRLYQLDYNEYEKLYLQTVLESNICDEFNTSVKLNPSEYYTNELYWGRYLKYKINSYNISGNNIFTDELNAKMKKSFSFNHQIELKSSYNYSCNLSFSDVNEIEKLKINFEYKYNPNTVTINIYNDTSLISTNYYAFYEAYEIGHVNIQFKNNLLSIAIKNKFESYVYNYYTPYKYSNCSTNNLLLGNYQLDLLTTSNLFQYSNGSNFAFRTNEFDDETQLFYNADDYYQITHNLFEIVTYFRENVNIKMKSFTNPSTIKDSKGNNLYLVSTQLTKIITNFSRNIDDCYLRLTDVNKLNYYIFDVNDEILNKSRELIIEGYSGGGYISYLIVYSRLSSQLLLKIDIQYFVTTIYASENPNENLLTVLATQILVPFCVFGVIVYGFKSNSNSKYLGFIGMFVGIFTLYLLEYMSIMFLIISSIILGIGLYFIIKSEKGDEI